MTTMDTNIKLRELAATFRDVTVTFDGYQTRSLARVNLDVRRGEILGVLGAKGAGKSTVLKLLAGRMRPNEGAVKVFGSSPRSGGSKARIGYVPGKADSDRPGFLARILGRKGPSQPIARSGLSQAILGSRDLVVLDEPFADASPEEKAELKGLLRDLAAKGKTVVVSDETLVDLKDVCDRLIIFHEGRVQGAGSLTELLAAPGAIRFLAPVLPSEIAGRIAKMLREEIVKDTTTPVPKIAPPHSISPLPAAKESDTAVINRSLASLTKPTESIERTEKADEVIDHEKLEGLTKPSTSD